MTTCGRDAVAVARPPLLTFRSGLEPNANQYLCNLLGRRRVAVDHKNEIHESTFRYELHLFYCIGRVFARCSEE
jgi:hypothetical protein